MGHSGLKMKGNLQQRSPWSIAATYSHSQSDQASKATICTHDHWYRLQTKADHFSEACFESGFIHVLVCL